MKVFGIVLALVLTISTYLRLLSLTNLDIYAISVRRSYYPPPISRIFQNKLTTGFYQARTQVFSLLSFDYVFRTLGYE
ncbi:hypothetical protein A3D85_02685 [Candidatus Amesbacteria bacterium RIFCSPHIGHO2_02_FULL_47_9]|uniref:Uncharacterized protein n=1 Tax=Candidatus Amesbacteria bacterium RIFCSPHIGHO2_01_FULL_48_32b TaxID=1797253 RepID=A0A1F4YG05_9BACT|nr:MAG: hypothetical protein A2876_02705 [Candidatus Amesbacteria bacterium RIFCSPHIGHO2_01_FULL_48_32b]OGD02784.1 MAG: hypothetical protein A3D85_02685 [Candidatus Amesbacteria bacterium RIFCSPHIGHO2_02_FULL_47_9]OGD08127.1 MAG: hypothetical protein A2899_02150 [Candidatus Amesbacteria bacterium RIFCSPLOWO2_01_FULL_49_25]